MKVGKAEEMICPFMSGQVGNAVDVGISFQTCICGDCMAWEYTKKDKRKIFKTTFVTPKGWEFVEYDTNNNMVCVQDIEEDEKEGYCKRLK